MFIRQKKNKSGSISVQIISKVNSRYKVVQSMGSSLTQDGLSLLLHRAKHTLAQLQKQSSLFVAEEDAHIESFLSTLHNAQISVIGPELIFGKIYNAIGFNAIKEDLFRHLVISRLAFPLSKLKTIDYLYRYQGVTLNINTVYRFLDKLNRELKQQVEQIAYQHTLKLLKNKVTVVFYDMTTLYFEASEEDDLRKAGFSKDGKHQNPQIYLGLLVSLGGYVIGYDIFEGSIYEGHTLIPVIEKLSKKFKLSKPIVVADAGLLSGENISALEQNHYEYILGARIKSERKQITQQVLGATLNDGEYTVIQKQSCKLIVSYSANRARKDAHNRKRGFTAIVGVPANNNELI